MIKTRFTYLFWAFTIFLLAALNSCQKDSSVKDPDTVKSSFADSSSLSSPGNFLAATGTLKIKFNDSTYTFDASQDSIALINVRGEDDSRYFGITAINKNHDMSFGISSTGYIYSNIKRGIAGSQLLINTNVLKPEQYSLSKFSGDKDLGKIAVAQYNEGNQLVKGTFYTFLAKDAKPNSPFYRVEGSFDLKLNRDTTKQ